MTKVYSVVGTDHMDLDSLELFKEHELLTLNPDSAREFVEILKANEYDLYCSVMEDVREKFQAEICEAIAADIIVFSKSKAPAIIEHFEVPFVEAVTKFITAKLYDYGIE